MYQLSDSSQHLFAILVLTPTRDKRIQAGKKSQDPGPLFFQHSVVWNPSTSFQKYWDESEIGFLARVQLVPNKEAPLC